MSPPPATHPALESRGLHPGEARAAGFRVDPEGRLLAPVRNASGDRLAVRCYADDSLGSVRLSDQGHARFEVGSGLALAGQRVFDPTPAVVLPTQSEPRADVAEIGAILVQDEVGAEIAARRLGLTAVAPSDGRLVEEAATLACKLADSGTVAVALRRNTSLDGLPASGRRFARAVAAIEAAGGRPLLVGLPPNGSLEDELRTGRQLRLRTATPELIRLDGSGAFHLRLLAGLTGVGRRLLAWRLSFSARRWARIDGPPIRSIDSMPDRYHANLSAAAEFSALARDAGMELIAAGGFATDLNVGGPIRERKDVDLLVDRWSAEGEEHLLELALGHGYNADVYLPGRFIRLSRNNEMVELFIPRPTPHGRSLMVPGLWWWLPEDFGSEPPRSLGPLQMRALRPDILLAMKEVQLRQVNTCFPRHEMHAAGPKIADIAALRVLLGIRHDPLQPIHDGTVRLVHVEPDLGLTAARQISHFLGVRFGKRQQEHPMPAAPADLPAGNGGASAHTPISRRKVTVSEKDPVAL